MNSDSGDSAADGIYQYDWYIHVSTTNDQLIQNETSGVCDRQNRPVFKNFVCILEVQT